MILRSIIAFGLLLAAALVPQTAPVPADFASATPARPGFLLQSGLPVPPPEVIAAETAPGPAAQPFAAREASFGTAVDCLTAAVYYEARSEPADGQRAVAQVVLNRVRHPAFPNSVCGVVYQGSSRSTGCQFSFTCDGSMTHPREPGAWARAREIAEAALGGYVYAPIGLATHYHTTAIHPWWASSMTRAVTVGSHIFYRWPGQWGDPLAFRRSYAGVEGGAPAPAADGVVRLDPAAVETVLGVTIHRGSATAAAAPRSTVEGSVRVHRAGNSAVTVHSGTPAGES